MHASQRPDAPLKLTVAGDTHIGQRDHNEDAVLIRRDLDLFILADGAGGDQAGNIASALATTSIAQYFEDTLADAARTPEFDQLGLPTGAKRLVAAVQRANQEIVDLARSRQKYHGMGTTVLAVHCIPQRGIMHIAHVGDSRCYRVRDGKLELLTRDHSLENDVLELEPTLDEERMAALPRNVVTHALGTEPRIRVSVDTVQVYPDDRYLLCSDGLSDELDEAQICDALLEETSPEAQVQLLFDTVNAAGADDNVAAVVMHCELKPGAADVPRPAPLRGKPDREELASSGTQSPGTQPEIVVIDYEDEEHEPHESRATANGSAAEAREAAQPSWEAGPSGPAAAEPDPDATAVQRLEAPFPRASFSDEEATMRFPRRCPQCGCMFQGTKNACPNCWDV